MFGAPPAPPPKKNPRRGVVDVPVPVPPPEPPEPPEPPALPGGGPLPAGRAGRVTPCDFRQATSWARLALPVVLPLVPDAEAEAVVLLDALVEEPLLALPHAASRPPAARVASAIATRLDDLNTAFLS